MFSVPSYPTKQMLVDAIYRRELVKVCRRAKQRPVNGEAVIHSLSGKWSLKVIVKRDRIVSVVSQETPQLTEG